MTAVRTITIRYSEWGEFINEIVLSLFVGAAVGVLMVVALETLYPYSHSDRFRWRVYFAMAAAAALTYTFTRYIDVNFVP